MTARRMIAYKVLMLAAALMVYAAEAVRSSVV